MPRRTSWAPRHRPILSLLKEKFIMFSFQRISMRHVDSTVLTLKLFGYTISNRGFPGLLVVVVERLTRRIIHRRSPHHLTLCFGRLLLNFICVDLSIIKSTDFASGWFDEYRPSKEAPSLDFRSVQARSSRRRSLSLSWWTISVSEAAVPP